MSNFPDFVFVDDTTLIRTSLVNTVRSEMEAGPDKVRSKQTIPMFNVTFVASLSSEDLREFRAWHLNVLRSGSGWFFMNDPFDGTRRRFRFLDEEIAWEKVGNLLQARLHLESYDEL